MVSVLIADVDGNALPLVATAAAAAVAAEAAAATAAAAAATAVDACCSPRGCTRDRK